MKDLTPDFGSACRGNEADAFSVAVQANDFDKARAIAEGNPAVVNAATSKGLTPLVDAVLSYIPHLDAKIDFLLDLGADPIDVRTKSGGMNAVNWAYGHRSSGFDLAKKMIEGHEARTLLKAPAKPKAP